MEQKIHLSCSYHHATSDRACAYKNGITQQGFGYALLFFIFQATLIGCNNNATNPAAGTGQAPAPNVKVAQALTRVVTEWDEYTGRVEAVNAVDIRARVSGYLDKVNFTAGSKVNKGDLLFLIDPKPFKAQLNYAVAELERAKTKRNWPRMIKSAPRICSGPGPFPRKNTTPATKACARPPPR